MFTSTLTPLTFGSPQCQEATHPILPTQPFLQQSLHQRVVVEQPLHPQPQPQLLLLQELQPQFLLDFYIWEPQSQPESRFIGQTWQKQTLDFPECIGRLEQPEETSQQGLVQSALWPHDVFFYWLSWIFTADNNSIPLVSQRTPLCLSEGINTVMKCKRWCVHGHRDLTEKGGKHLSWAFPSGGFTALISALTASKLPVSSNAKLIYPLIKWETIEMSVREMRSKQNLHHDIRWVWQIVANKMWWLQGERFTTSGAEKHLFALPPFSLYLTNDYLLLIYYLLACCPPQCWSIFLCNDLFIASCYDCCDLPAWTCSFARLPGEAGYVTLTFNPVLGLNEKRDNWELVSCFDCTDFPKRSSSVTRSGSRLQASQLNKLRLIPWVSTNLD